MKTANIKPGSALIMTVVLTVLLALVGALFVMGARLDKMATASISDNEELNAGVDSVIEKISQVLIDDVPGVAGEEYYDYPGPRDSWLANLEPAESGGIYWPQVSDPNGTFGTLSIEAKIISDYQDPTEVDDSKLGNIYPADADGDGVSDSVWVKLNNISTAKGNPIFAAIRIIDHGAMLNVNTAYMFDPNTANGSSQLQINLMALSWRPGDPCSAYNPNEEQELLNARANYGFGGVDPFNLLDYAKNVVWRPTDPCVPYTPFDISDELELRYRFLLNEEDVDTRIEDWGGEWRFPRPVITTPVTSAGRDFDQWFRRAYDSGIVDPNYAYRHIATTYNMDRIINAAGGKMANVNTDPVSEIYEALKKGIADTQPNRAAIAAQLAVNIVDFRDGNIDVTAFNPDGGVTTYYGFEPQPFISEIGIYVDGQQDPPAGEYAVELYNPFDVPIELDKPDNEFTLFLYDDDGTTIEEITFDDDDVIPAGGYFVIASDLAMFNIDPVADRTLEDNKLILSGNYVDTNANKSLDWCNRYNLALKRNVVGAGTVVVDRQKTHLDWFTWLSGDDGIEDYPQRDDDKWDVVYQTMGEEAAPGSLGQKNSYNDGDYINYNLRLPVTDPPTDIDFVTVGDIVLPLRIGNGKDPNDTIGEKMRAVRKNDDESKVRLDLINPAFGNIFQYLTVFPPAQYVSDPDETRIKGRININTAPWFVIAQLPWVSKGQNEPTNYNLAQAIVAYRDKLNTPVDYFRGGNPNSRNLATGITGLREDLGFATIGELNYLKAGPDAFRIDYYAIGAQSGDLLDLPDLTTREDEDGDGIREGDGAPDNFEERDVIFSRISNLATVRSDVFCVYILVRLGANGPQKRVMVILDRSDVDSADDKVKIVAYHPVPDPR